MNVENFKPEAQIKILKHICKRIADLDNDWLEGNAEGLLTAMVEVMDDQDGDDAWGTEGWQHFFGIEI